MLRPLGMIAGWVAATAAVVGLGWAAVGTVTGAVTDPPALAQPPVAVQGAGEAASPEPARDRSPAAATATPGTAGTPDATAPAAPPATPDDAATRTFDLAGGSVGVRASDEAVELLFATPRAGFSVDVRSRGPARVDVRFSSDAHESRFRFERGVGEQLEERPA